MNLEDQLRRPNLSLDPFFYVDSDNLKENINFINDKGIINLFLIPNENGYKLKDLTFLEEVPQIKSLKMAACRDIENFESLSRLEYLEEIVFESPKKVKVDLSNLKSLKKLGFKYGPKITGYQHLRKLEWIGVDNPNENFLNNDIFSHFTMLKEFHCGRGAPGNLEFLSNQTQLDHLVLDRMKSFDLTGIEKLKPCLKTFKLISSKKVENIDLISRLENLEHLILSNSVPLESAEVIKDLKKLKALTVRESSFFINGDLRSIKHLRDNLEHFAVKNKKHYFYETEQIDDLSLIEKGKVLPQQDEIKKRKQVALNAIKKSFGTSDAEYDVDLFIKHHLEEIESDYWVKHLKTEKPKAEQVLDLLVLESSWGNEDDSIENFDFTLPEGATNYMICVSFDENGKVEDISMES